MALKNIYEVFEDFRKAKTKTDRIDVLRKNDTYALRNVIFGAMYPKVEFDVEIVPFKRVEMPPGMSYSHMTEAIQRVYLFQKNNPRVSPNLTQKRKTELLIQILESLEEKEADVYISMLKKDLKVPYLTEALVNEAFPQLLPQHNSNP